MELIHLFHPTSILLLLPVFLCLRLCPQHQPPRHSRLNLHPFRLRDNLRRPGLEALDLRVGFELLVARDKSFRF
ncbi:hypothetical protein P167DRAFT_540793 [Morchella conica CCBAS932]|uniref:Uncharacterized protein n=1 Tax=Morchella conica CCBAS932 TaxID=1392247 RepID=A0A3N4K7P7_9PEZI|nr:hypothetical protein P167DRAFT_540793 [Morchella conica CCBAS932]